VALHGKTSLVGTQDGRLLLLLLLVVVSGVLLVVDADRAKGAVRYIKEEGDWCWSVDDAMISSSTST